jgi:mutator protein MutT
MNYNKLIADAVSNGYDLGVCAAVIYENKVLLIQRAQNDNYNDIWEMPGGGVDIGENPKMSLIRELQEEVGIIIDIDNLKYLDYFEFHNIEKNIHKRKFCFKVTINSNKIILSHEHSNYKFFSSEEVILLKDSATYPDNYNIWTNHYDMIMKVLKLC